MINKFYNQTELTIIPESAVGVYDLNLITETEDSIYWTLDLDDINKFDYKIYLSYNIKE